VGGATGNEAVTEMWKKYFLTDMWKKHPTLFNGE